MLHIPEQPETQLSYDYALMTSTFTVFSTTTGVHNIIVTSKCSSPSESLPLKL